MDSRYAQAGALRMHYVQHGAGEPVILIHGFPQTSHEWRQVMPLMGDAFSLHAIDTRGHGLTEKPADPDSYSRLSLATDVVNFMDAMGWDQVSVVAHDWGGIIASKLSLEFGDRVKRLALLDTITTGWPTFVDYYYWFMSPGRADGFFRAHARDFIETMFLGETANPCPPPPGSPWNMPRDLIAKKIWASPADIDHYTQAMAASAAQDVDLNYYRNMEFHRVVADASAPHGERYEPLNHAEMGKLWEAGKAGADYVDYAVGDRHKVYTGPTLWMYNTHLLDASGSVAGARGPEGDPAWDNFRRHYPNLSCQGVPAGHFFVEERPDLVAEALRAFLSA